MPINRTFAVVAIIALPSWLIAQENARPESAIPGIRCQVHLRSSPSPLGRPVWAQFAIENMSDVPITLTVPGAEPEIPSPEMGLPLAHIFSGGALPSLIFTTEAGRRIEEPAGYRPTHRAPIVMIAAHSTVGATIDLREYYPILRGAGQYRLTWRPYAGGAVCDNIPVTIAPLKQAELVTDEGKMMLRFYYEEAPLTVANFLELAKSGFYNGKTFHRLEPGYLLQGGCPRGDGTGIRLDGKRLPSEINDQPHQKGTVSMALLEDDPDSASCQFFISNTRQKDWDGKYTVFAELSGQESLATLDRLMATSVDPAGRPTRALHLRTVRVMDAPPEPYSP